MIIRYLSWITVFEFRLDIFYFFWFCVASLRIHYAKPDFVQFIQIVFKNRVKFNSNLDWIFIYILFVYYSNFVCTFKSQYAISITWIVYLFSAGILSNQRQSPRKQVVASKQRPCQIHLAYFIGLCQIVSLQKRLRDIEI